MEAVITLPQLLPEVMKKTSNLCSYSRFSGRNLNLGLPKYEAGVLTTWPSHYIFVK
jgi:hypothetical protein